MLHTNSINFVVTWGLKEWASILLIWGFYFTGTNPWRIFSFSVWNGVSWPSGPVHWTQVLVLSECVFESRPGRSRRLCLWARHLNHNCFVLRMGREAVGSACCVMHVKEPRTLVVKEKGLAPVFLDSRLEHPAGWIICARYKSPVLLLLLIKAYNLLNPRKIVIYFFKSAQIWIIYV